MLDPMDVAASYRRKSDECGGHARNATAMMTRMEWIRLAAQWQAVAGGVVFSPMVRTRALLCERVMTLPSIDSRTLDVLVKLLEQVCTDMSVTGEEHRYA